MQELKKKTYALGEITQKIRDPLIFTNKLTSSRKLVNELRVVPESERQYASGVDLMEAYYDGPADQDNADNPEGSNDEYHHPRKFKPFRTSRPEPRLNACLDYNQALSLVDNQQEQGRKKEKASKSKNKEEVVEIDEFMMGKRIPSKNGLPDKETIHRPKYCDPLTGAYYNTIEEFKKIRYLKAQDEVRRSEKELQYLSIFLAQKRKKLHSSQAEDSNRTMS